MPRGSEIARQERQGKTVQTVRNYTGSDILFPYRSPSPRPHPDPTQHPETDPKQTRNRPETEPNGAETEPNGAETDRNQALSGGTAQGGLSAWGEGGVVREKENH